MDRRERRLRLVSPAMRDIARGLRQRTTPAEAILWEALRDRRLANVKFRRQHAVMGMVLDFFCPRAHLAIEIDGGVHDDPGQQAADAARTVLLNGLGIRVLRLPNDLVLSDLSAALQYILDAVSITADKLPLCPSQMGEGAGG